jgi:hypothetical protein
VAKPKKDIDEAVVSDLAYRGASNRDIGAILGCDHVTIASRFSPILTKRRAERRMSIRDAQNAALQAGNTAMLVWLGKQELDQVDKVVQQAPDGGTTVVIKRVNRAPKA